MDAAAGSDTPGDGSASGDASAGADGRIAACSPRPATGLLLASTLGLSALGVAGSTLYMGVYAGTTPASGTIYGVPLGGGAKRPLVAPEYLLGGFAFDASRIYYPRMMVTTTDAGMGLVASGLVSEDRMTQVARNLPNPQAPVDFAATAARPGVFWLGGPVEPAGPATTLYFWDPQSNVNAPLAAGEDLQGVAVDGTGVYWADTGGQQNTIYKAPLAGGPSSVLATVPWSVVRGGVVGLSSTSVVFASDGVAAGPTGFPEASIEAVAKAGGPVRHVLTADFAGFGGFRVDDDQLYWVEQSKQGRLQRIPLAGGNPELIWDEPPPGRVEQVAFDACNVYVGVTNVSMTLPTPDPQTSDTVYVDQVYARGK
jgi:hypothetical protein